MLIFLGAALPIGFLMGAVAATQFFQAQVSFIANQACQVADNRKYWLGKERKGFSAADSEAITTAAAEHAREMCTMLGLTNVNPTVSFDNASDGNHPKFDLTICTIEVKDAKIPFALNVMGFDLARLFKGNFVGRGICTHPKISPYAVLEIDAPAVVEDKTEALATKDRDIAVIPVYGFFKQNLASGSSQNEDYGCGHAPTEDALNFFALNSHPVPKSEIKQMVAGTWPNSWPVTWHPTHKITMP
jgi:hypothetical protein